MALESLLPVILEADNSISTGMLHSAIFFLSETPLGASALTVCHLLRTCSFARMLLLVHLATAEHGTSSSDIRKPHMYNYSKM